MYSGKWLSLLCGIAWSLVPPAESLQHPELTESSGVCVSSDGRWIWSHNDSGDRPRLFAFDRQGQSVTIGEMKSARAKDWEDICAFSVKGQKFLAVGDVGDNDRRRHEVHIYVVREPSLSDRPKSTIELPTVCRLTVTYPQGALNCEALAYDPQRQVFVLASKENWRCQLFTVDASRLTEDRQVDAKLLQTVILPQVTGADISRDGKRLALATYGPGCMLYRDEEGNWKTDGEALQMFELPMRKQGESICFDGASKLLLTSEFAPTPLFSIPCPAEPKSN